MQNYFQKKGAPEIEVKPKEYEKGQRLPIIQ